MNGSDAFGPFHPGKRVLLGPGPSEVPARVLQAMAAPLVGHLDPAFLRLMNELQGMLRQVFKTENGTTFAVSGTGMAGMEACLANLLEPGDKLLVGVNGVFGGRMVDMAGRMGVEVTTIERPWGETFDPAEVKAAVGDSQSASPNRPVGAGLAWYAWAMAIGIAVVSSVLFFKTRPD